MSEDRFIWKRGDVKLSKSNVEPTEQEKQHAKDVLNTVITKFDTPSRKRPPNFRNVILKSCRLCKHFQKNYDLSWCDKYNDYPVDNLTICDDYEEYIKCG